MTLLLTHERTNALVLVELDQATSVLVSNGHHHCRVQADVYRDSEHQRFREPSLRTRSCETERGFAEGLTRSDRISRGARHLAEIRLDSLSVTIR